MNLSTAINISGGIILGFCLFIIAIIICFVGVIVKKRKNTYKKGSFINKPAKITGVIGLAVVLISFVAMAFTSSYSDVKLIFSTLGSDKAVIYNDKYYVKTDFVLNGESGKYEYSEPDSNPLSGAGKLYCLKGYDSYDILVSQDSNITGSIFIYDKEEKDFNSYYSDYSKYETGVVFDKHNSQMESTMGKCSPELYSKLANSDNYKEVSEEKVPNAEDINNTRNYIFWATSKDQLISSQIKLFPKDENKNYVMYDGESFYELKSSLGREIDTIVKNLK